MNEFLKHRTSLLSEIYEFNENNFEKLALKLFHFQKKYCKLYREFILSTRRDHSKVEFSDIPFLPISAFKNHVIQTGQWEPEIIFKSSGTTNLGRSKHAIRDVKRYINFSRDLFKKSIVISEKTKMLALLPSYRSQGESSLLCMIDGISRQLDFLGYNDNPLSNVDEVLKTIESSDDLIIFGVSFSLLDLAERAPSDAHFRIIDTGGMKGRRREITVSELHSKYKEAWPNAEILSEFGMTELNSQLYSRNGWYSAVPSLKIYQKDINDHFGSIKSHGRGRAYCIDLLNIDSCCFIETDDLVNIKGQTKYQILGRLDHSDFRGCNQLYVLN